MGLGERLGLAGLIVALFSIAAFYLWPEQKWIGWLCLLAAIALLLAWACFEFPIIPTLFRRYLATSVFMVLLCGGLLAARMWWNSSHRFPVVATPPEVKKIEAPPPAITAPKLTDTRHLSAKCSLPKDLSVCEVKCSVDNPRNTPVTSVSVGFNGVYPYETKLAAGTETHMAIKKQETLPLPMTGGYIDHSLQAFSVEIPLMPPKTELAFSLWTTSEVNQKACEYIKTTIRAEQHRKIDKLISMNPTDRQLDADRMISLQAKLTSLFVPGFLMNSEIRRKVEFITGQEEKAAKNFGALYEKQGKSIVGMTCLLPIFAAERTDGNLQYFSNAPPMMTWIFNKESMKQIGNRIETDPHPPERYFCTQ